MRLENQRGITKMEILIIVFIVVVLAMLVMPIVRGYQDRQFIWVMSGTRQLQLATFNLSLEREAAGESPLAWPGDQGGMFSNWIVCLSSILSTNDLRKSLMAPGFRVRPEDIYCMDKTVLRVYAVTQHSDLGTGSGLGGPDEQDPPNEPHFTGPPATLTRSFCGQGLPIS